MPKRVKRKPLPGRAKAALPKRLLAQSIEPIVVRLVKRDTVTAIVELRAQLDLREKLVGTTKEQLKKLEEGVIADLKANVPLEAGCPKCLVQVEMKRHPAWRQIFESRLSKAEAEIELAKVKPVPYEKLVIEGALNGGP